MENYLRPSRETTAMSERSRVCVCVCVCRGRKGKVKGMSDCRGHGALGRTHPTPPQMGQYRLGRPKDAKRISDAVTVHLRTHCAGTFAQKAREKADTIPVRADSTK